MATIVRHGGAAHFMRPDRVYRTGVISPMTGYQPQADVNAIAQEFATGPVRGMMLEGLRGLGQPGPIKRLVLRVQAALYERQARKFMGVQGLGNIPGPSYMMAQQISPHLAAQMTGVVNIMQRTYNSGFPVEAGEAMTYRPIQQWYR